MQGTLPLSRVVAMLLCPACVALNLCNKKEKKTRKEVGKLRHSIDSPAIRGRTGCAHLNQTQDLLYALSLRYSLVCDYTVLTSSFGLLSVGRRSFSARSCDTRVGMGVARCSFLVP